MFDWILQNARLEDDDGLKDIAIQSGLIAAIEPAGVALQNASTKQKRDLNSRVLLPGFVDCHTHLDKTYSILDNETGTLGEAIKIWQAYRQTRTADTIRASAERAIQTAIKNGVTAMRSHIDVVTSDDMLPVEVLLELREKYRNSIDLEFVALGTAAGKTEWRSGMLEALKIGVDLVGGCPALCPDPEKEIDALFEIAAETGKGIDLHIDETEDPQTTTLEILAEKTLDTGMIGRVTAGHCCSLSFVDDETRARIIDKVASAQINVVTLPSCNLVLMGRQMHPAPRGITPVKQLIAAGVNVSAASDNVGDPFNPFGSYNLLSIATLSAHVAHMTGRDDLYASLEMVTRRPGQVMGLNSTVALGHPADLAVLDCTKKIEAVLAPPTVMATFKRGVLVAETIIEQKGPF